MKNIVFLIVPGFVFIAVPALFGDINPEDTSTPYTVLFDSNSGSAIASQTVDSGLEVAAPTGSTHTGFTFAGWYSEATLTTAYGHL